MRASGSRVDGWPVGVAVFAGLTIKIAFMVLGWFMSVTFMPSFSPYFLVYFFVDDLLGAFVAGLIVGYLVQDKRRSALYGFVSAGAGTVILSLVTGSGLVFPPGFLFFLPYVVLDVVALVGGYAGVMVSSRVVKAAFLAVVVCSALLVVPGVAFAPVRHRGRLIIQGNASLVIADCVYEQDGDVVIGGNASLTVRNVEFDLMQMGRNYSIQVVDYGRLVIENVTLNVLTDINMLNSMSVIVIRDNASATFRGANVVAFNLEAYNYSTVSLVDSQFVYGTVKPYDHANVTSTNSTVGGILLPQTLRP